jgi:hypothetical protein
VAEIYNRFLSNFQEHPGKQNLRQNSRTPLLVEKWQTLPQHAGYIVYLDHLISLIIYIYILYINIYHLVMTNIAMENPQNKWRFLAGKIIYFYGPFSMAM